MTRAQTPPRLSIVRRSDVVDYRALADFRFALREFRAFSEAAAADVGLTSQQHQALLTIKGVGEDNGLSIGKLAERLLIRQHSAVELANRLESAGLAIRAPDPSDGRRVLLRLTAEGEDVLRSLSSSHLHELRSVGPALMQILLDLQTSTLQPETSEIEADRPG